MNPLDELEALMQAMPLDWQCAAPGLKVGVDNEVDAVITVHGPQILQGLTPPPDPADAPRGALRQLRLTIAARPSVTILPLSTGCGSPPVWTLPDLGWDETVSVALRFRVPAARARQLHRMVPLAQATLSAVAVHGDGGTSTPVELQLRMGCAVLPDDEYAGFPGDPEAEQALNTLIGQRVAPQPAAAASGDPHELH